MPSLLVPPPSTAARQPRLSEINTILACRKPYHSLNFVIAHDGFTLADLVAYNSKHNDANGEGNRDGEHTLSDLPTAVRSSR